jgi:ubiquitin-like 1-activating enzyme E1 A
VLAGLRAVICDSRPYEEALAGSPSFFINEIDSSKTCDGNSIVSPNKRPKMLRTVADSVRKSIEDLNPLLGECETLELDIKNITSDVLTDFDIVVASRIGAMDATRITNALRKTQKKGKFFMADCFGLNGACCMDLGQGHTYLDDIGKTLQPPKLMEPYVPLEDIFEVVLDNCINRFHKSPPNAWVEYRSILEFTDDRNEWPSYRTTDEFVSVVGKWIEQTSPNLFATICSDSFLRNLSQIASAELAPVCSVLGGIVANEVIKAISGKGAPANNVLICDGLACKTWSFLVQRPPSS